MSHLELDDATERIAVSLLRHLEWQPEGFSIVFLFGDVGPSLQMADWLDQRLRSQGLPLYRQEVGDDFARDPEAMVDALIAQFSVTSAQPGALWFGLQRHPNDAQWNLARRKYLARLNERRFLLERDLKRPLVLVLPSNFRPETRNIAPDIWHVRALSAELHAPGAVNFNDRGRTLLESAPSLCGSELMAYREWQRIQEGGATGKIFLPTALSACTELLSAGRPADAEQVAHSALLVARERAIGRHDNTALQDLSISLDSLGMVARAQGNWAQAEDAFRESLSLHRKLAEIWPNSPSVLRDLSVSLNNLAAVVYAQGDLVEAETAYRESLGLRRQLANHLGGTPHALRELSISLNYVGELSCARGDWPKAEAEFTESVNLCRQLFARLGSTPEAMRELAISLHYVGEIACAQCDWVKAAAVFSESLHLARQLVERFGSVPDTLRVLALSLDNVAKIASTHEDWANAEANCRESLRIARQLVETLGGTPEALRELSVSLNNYGQVARAQGNWSQAEILYRESLSLTRQLLKRLGRTPMALNDLAVSLCCIAKIPPGNVDAGIEAITIFETLAANFPHVTKYAERLAMLRDAVQKLKNQHD